MQGSGRLRVAHFDEGCAEHDTIAAIVVETSEFGFGGGGHDVFEDATDGVDGAVIGRLVGWWFGRIRGDGAEVEVAANTAASARFREVGCVAVDVEDHAAGVVSDGGILVRGGIVQEFGEGFGCVFGAFGLGGGEGAEGDKHGGVNSSGIVGESADDLLDSGDSGGVESGGVIIDGSELDGSAVGGLDPDVGRIFGSIGNRVLEPV